MPTYTQRGRPLSVLTPLGQDVLLLEALSGSEAISELFEFRLDLLADPDADIPFEKVLGKPIAVSLASREGDTRYFTGIVSRFAQGPQVRARSGDTAFVRYQATVVPAFWLLTRRSQSRIFQQLSVHEILTKVLNGLDVAWKLEGTYEPRDYCVQYRETDFDFASRLMEEEGIFYFFEHGNGVHKLVVADNPRAHPKVPGQSTLLYETVEGGLRPEDRVIGWVKTQEVRSGKHTLWDHCFEFPGDNLEAREPTPAEVTVGSVTHTLKVADNDKLELYDFPGGYAQRFDGVAPGGSDRPDDVQKIYADNGRTTKIRMEQEAALGIRVEGESTCRQLTAGHAFTLEQHFNADGGYVVTRVEHRGSIASEYLGSDRSAADEEPYANTFQAIPKGLAYRPQRLTPRPRVAGTQTATVTGPEGEEIFTDKYGRIKVQFHWDREGRYDADSSCWVRVSQVHAGQNWGGIDVPRIGEEVVIAFEEGDPDQPMVVGRVYNAGQMPPFTLPGKRMVSGIKTNSYKGGGGSNEISMDDTKGTERMYVHAQFNQDEVVEHDQTSHVKNCRTKNVDVDETTTVGNDRTETVHNNETITVDKNRTESVGIDEAVTVGANHTHTVGANHTESVGANMALTVGAAKTEMVTMTSTETVGLAKATTVGLAYTLTVGAMAAVSVGASMTVTVMGGMSVSVGSNRSVTVGGNASESVAKKKAVTAGDEINLVCGDAQIVLKKDGSILIKGKDIVIEGSGKITAKASGDMVLKGSKIGAN